MRARRRLVVAVAYAITATSALAADDYARRLDALIDRFRASIGLQTLQPDANLAALALEHSQAMAKSHRLGHEGFEARFARSGFDLCVENVGWNYHTPQAQFDAWRASPGHDRNLRDARVTHAGAGEASGYVTWIACASK